MLRMRLALSSAVVALSLVGCGGDSGDGRAAERIDPEPTATSTRTGAKPSGTGGASPDGGGNDGQVRVSVPESLDFTGTTVSGDDFEGASLAGRPTLLWFWAPWCPTCRGQIPQVEGLAEEHAGALNVIGVGSLDSAEAIEDFADDVSGVIHLEDAEGELWKRFGVTEQSSFVLLDADGSVVFEAGYGGSEELGARVDDVLG